MSKKEAYQQKVEAQLDEWKADIDKLKSKADQANASAQVEYYEQIEQLKTKQEAVSSKFEELRNSSDDAWSDVKSGLELAKESLSEAMDSASKRFR
ncbi:coiled coil domain-containing protein [Oceanospirillum linum]|uniref:Coiled coil domain-containing protein n=1 Tax=Oceanospirillum linum TaxID=966 RepID=A0A1T1HF83_OCELI|nr:coiled coil domain-containing protein [Oceanospirillum linum]OOV88367.1 coiled coil domain-containing protein [Oceanospirillum linum]SEF53636.1 hypothetical protein SAMN04489856_101471 [Oleiphilus messinensis]SMP04724.1 hypothetical protein SAMN06264348_101472 [Oceanospirillum linum]